MWGFWKKKAEQPVEESFVPSPADSLLRDNEALRQSNAQKDQELSSLHCLLTAIAVQNDYQVYISPELIQIAGDENLFLDIERDESGGFRLLAFYDEDGEECP